MMTLFGNREILTTLNTPYRTWLQKTCPPIDELCAPEIIAVRDAFGPIFLPSVVTMRDTSIVRNKGEKCLPF